MTKIVYLNNHYVVLLNLGNQFVKVGWALTKEQADLMAKGLSYESN